MIMFSLPFLFVFLCWISACLVTASSPSRHLARANQQKLPCLKIMAEVNQDKIFFWADEVAACITRVPFVPEIATHFLDWWNQTLQYQSTLDVLKDPPEGYQRDPVDVQEELQSLRYNVTTGVYVRQYDFEKDLQLLIAKMHDVHVLLDAGLLAAFRFASPYDLVSASPDGKQSPRLYLLDDVLAADPDSPPSHITHINQKNASEYMSDLAQLNAKGFVEDHGDWNDLMASPATDIQGMQNALQGLIFYPGNELNFTFSDGSEINTFWQAVYKDTPRTPKISTASDFYTYFVADQMPDGDTPEDSDQWWPPEYTLPQNSDGDTDGDQDTTSDTSSVCKGGSANVPNWCQVWGESVTSYPNNPVVAQKDIYTTSGGAVTGYILDDISTGVLSIPTFFDNATGINDFNEAVEYFIGNTSDKTQHVIIDLQGNLGGDVYLAFSTFRQFFEPEQPWTGSRIRNHPLANILGKAYSQWWQNTSPDDRTGFAASEWVVLNRYNADTDKLFASWADYFIPNSASSRRQAYNLNDTQFYKAYFGTTEFNSGRTPPKWPAENITLLTDGTCSSACALFVEFMTRKGVKTISVGGNPRIGPMQTASGNRGASVYQSTDLDNDYDWLRNIIGDTKAADLLPSRDYTGMRVKGAQITIRDQMRDKVKAPLQFLYDASDCRIYYTLKNVYNMTQLWRDAAKATWHDKSLCVKDSTDYSTKAPPLPKAHNYTTPSLPTNENEPPESIADGRLDAQKRKSPGLQKCNIDDDDPCPQSTRQICVKMHSECADPPIYACVDPCTSWHGDPSPLECHFQGYMSKKFHVRTMTLHPGKTSTTNIKRFSGWYGPATVVPKDIKGAVSTTCPKATAASRSPKPTASAKPKHSGKSGSSPSRFINHGLNFDGE